jgi:hypothetical protein
MMKKWKHTMIAAAMNDSDDDGEHSSTSGEMISTTVPGPWAMKVARCEGRRSSG